MHAQHVQCVHINITDIKIEDEDIEKTTANENMMCKRVTIKFIPVLKDDWRKKYDENKGKMREHLVESGSP